MAIGVVQIEILKYLICHVTSQNNLIKESCYFISGSFSLHVFTLPGLMVIGIMIVEIYYFKFVT